MEIITTNIFVDTSSYEQENFAFNHYVLKELSMLGHLGKITLYFTQITSQEILRHLEEKSEQACLAIKRLKKDDNLKILKNCPDIPHYNIFSLLNHNELYEKLKYSFENFLEYSNAKEIPLYELMIAPILDKYFGNKPPFGQGRKKYEFPDAFVIEALSYWCIKNSQKIYIISSDSDFQKSCELTNDLIYLPRISSFIDLYNQHSERARFVEIAKRILEQQRTTIQDRLQKDFAVQQFISEAGSNEEIDEITVKSVYIDDYDVINADEAYAEFDLEVSFDFEAVHRYDDPNTTTYDRGSGEYWSLYRCTVTGAYNEVIHCYLKLTYENEGKGNTVVDEVLINDSNVIRLNFNPIENISYTAWDPF